MLWHLIDTQGRIVRSITARTRAEAHVALGSGSVVSDASWKLDTHKWKPVETVVTDIIQPQSAKRLQKMPRGYTSTADVAKRLDISPRRIRLLVEQSVMNVALFEYRRYGFTERQIQQLAKLHLATPEQTRLSVSKRRESYLETMRQRYAQGIHGRAMLR
jgi:hypothetical protein